MQADDVGAFKQLLQGQKFDAKGLGTLRRRIERPCHHLHADGLSQARHLCADGAGSHDAEALTLQHDVGGQQPPSFLECGCLHSCLLGDGEHEAEHVLGDERCINARLVRDHDAALAGRFQVDGIGAHRAGGDESQLGQLCEVRFPPGDGGTRIQNDVGFPHPRNLLFFAGRPIRINDHLSPGRQTLERR